MKLSLPNDVYIVRETGLPVEGRMKVYLHESDTYAEVFTIEGSEYVQAENPQLLHAGLPEASLFTETGVFDIVIEQYIGQEGAMSVESPDSDFSKIDEFQWGLDFDPEKYVATHVDTVAELRQVDPSVKVVDVLSYSAPGDCMPRTYIWDASSTNDEDGGYVIASDVSDTGRWILLWGDEMMPACVYGVTESNTANMNLLLNYPEYVGSFRLSTAPIVRIQAGTYSVSVTYATSKEIAFDNGAQFTAATFRCPAVRMLGGNGSYVANFVFTGPGVEAHSSWFRTVEAFWHCGAQTMCADSTNYFTDSALRTAASLTGITVKGSGSLVTSYVNGSYFQVVRVCSVPAGFFTANDYVRLSAGFGDEVFSASGSWDPGLISAGHHQQYDQVPDLHSFASADRWLAVMIERRKRISAALWNQTAIDLMGRTVSTFTMPSDGFAEISNMVVNGTLTTQRSVTLHGVKATLVTAGSDIQVAAYDSELTFSAACQGITSVSLTDCDTTVAGTGFNPADTVVQVTGGTFSGVVALGDMNINTYTASHPVVFRDVRFGSASTWKVHFISMVNCTGPIKINCYPYSDGSGFFTWNIELLDNLFTGNARVWFGVFADADHPNGALDGKCRMGKCKVVGNRFSGSDTLGIKRIHWNPITLNCLIADGGAWEYHGNSGNCPRLNPGFITNTGKWPTTQGTNPKWRIYDGSFNIWCPYLHYGDGSVAVAQESTGLNPYDGNTPYALFFTNDLSDSIGHYLYGYRTYYAVSDIQDLTDEDKNNGFCVKLAMGTYGPAVPTFDVGTTYFPGLDVV